MATYDFHSLSPQDFEDLVGDLVSAKEGRTLSRFKPGKDGGVDLRCYVDDSASIVVQCKHWLASGFAKLKSSLLETELPKIEKLTPERYVLATSVPLSPQQKDELAEILKPWIATSDDVLGQDDLNALLRAFPSVEKAHYKLWMRSTTVLERIVNAAVDNRSRYFLSGLDNDLKTYVASPIAQEAATLLERNHCLLIAGPPGVGKTTLARMLVGELASSGHSVVVVSGEIIEAEATLSLDAESRQVFFFDDFLGTSMAAESLTKNEDSRLIHFMKLIQSSLNKRFVLTTREHVLADALNVYERLDSTQVDFAKFTLDLSAYDDIQRARILYNHLHFSTLGDDHRRAIALNENFSKIIDHPNYSPRLVETSIQLAQLDHVDAETFLEFFLSNLSNPSKIWERSFRNELSEDAKAVLISLYLTGRGSTLADLRRLSGDLAEEKPADYFADRFEATLRTLDGTFLHTHREWREEIVVDIEPSVRDYITGLFLERPETLVRVVERASEWLQLDFLVGILRRSRSADRFDQVVESSRSVIERRAIEIVASGNPIRQFEWSLHPMIHRAICLLELSLSARSTWKGELATLASQTLRDLLADDSFAISREDGRYLSMSVAFPDRTDSDVVDAIRAAAMCPNLEAGLAAANLAKVDGLFDDREIEEMASDFHSWGSPVVHELLDRELSGSEEISSWAAEIDDIETVCVFLDVFSASLRDLRERVSEYGEYFYEPEDDAPRSGGRFVAENGSVAEITDLFRGLI